MNDPVLIALATTAAVIATEVVAPLIKRYVQKQQNVNDKQSDYRAEELKAATELRKEWQAEIRELRTVNKEINLRCDQLEDDLRQVREENRALRNILRQNGIEIPSPLI